MVLIYSSLFSSFLSSPKLPSSSPKLTTIKSLASHLVSKSSLIKSTPNSMLNKILQLSILTGKIERFVDQYDRPGYQKAHGFRSIIKVIDKFVPTLQKFIDNPLNGQNLDNNSTDIPSNIVQSIDSINSVLTILIEMCNLAIHCHENWLTIKDPKEKFLWLYRTFRYSYDKLQPELKQYWAYHQIYWYEPSIRSYLQTLICSFVVLSRLPGSLVTLLSKKEMGSNIAYFFWKGDPLVLTSLLNCVDDSLTNGIKRIFMKILGIKFTNLNIPRQKIWIIPTNGSTVTKNKTCSEGDPFYNGDYINIRLYQVTNLPPSGTVIVHVQGGGLLVDSHSVHMVYLKSWLPQLAGAVLFNINYSVCVHYPVALQEIVDALLWLTNPKNINQVASTLQFIPTRVIFLCDSVGAYLTLASLAILRDIRDQDPDDVGLFPTSMVCLSPVMAPVNLNYTPSNLLAFLDPILSPSLFLQILSLYCAGATLNSECHSTLDLPSTSTSPIRSTTSEYKEESSWFALNRYLFNQESPWYDVDPILFEKRLTKLMELAFEPYISILTSYDLTRLASDIKINLIISDLDVMLDNVFEFERVWKGSLTIDVVEDLTHAFYATSFVSEPAKVATQAGLNRLKQAIGL